MIAMRRSAPKGSVIGSHIHVVDRLAVFGLQCRVAHLLSDPGDERVTFALLDGSQDEASPDDGRPKRVADWATRGIPRFSWHTLGDCRGLEE